MSMYGNYCLLLVCFLICYTGPASALSDEALRELQPLINDVKNTVEGILKIPSFLIPDEIENSLKRILEDINKDDVLDALNNLKRVLQENLGFVGDALLGELKQETQALEVRYEQVASGSGKPILSAMTVLSVLSSVLFLL